MNNFSRKFSIFFIAFFIALKLSTCGDTNFIQYGKFSFCLIHSDRFFESEWGGGYREAGNNCNKRRSCSWLPIGSQLVMMYWPLFQPFFRHEQSVAVRRSTGNDVSGHYFCHYMFLIIFFLLFFSVMTFFHRKSNPIKKLILQKLFGVANNLIVDPVSHFGVPW